MSAVSSSAAPTHVPADLILDHVFAEQPGAEKDPYIANIPVLDLPPIYYSLKEGGPRRDGVWVLNRAAIIREAYQDSDLFSSNNATGFLRLVGRDLNLIPVELDPPEHTKYRLILNPRFTPGRMNEMEDSIRQRARELLDQVISKGACEFEVAFGRPFPVSIFLDLMDLPQDRLFEFVDWEEKLLHGATIEEVTEGASLILNYLEEVIAQKKGQGGADLASHIINGQVDGRPLTDDEIISMSFLIFFGGLDTVAATLNFAFKHLAEHPEDQQLLRDEPELIPNAVEELLRAYAVVPSPRVVTRDVEFHGVQMKTGDRVLLNVMMAGRDEAEVENPNKIDFRRENIRHLTFAAGVHRCVGSHLARREIRIALEEWMKFVPPFRTDPNDPPVTHARGVWGVKKLPLIWDPEATPGT